MMPMWDEKKLEPGQAVIFCPEEDDGPVVSEKCLNDYVGSIVHIERFHMHNHDRDYYVIQEFPSEISISRQILRPVADLVMPPELLFG